jgi:peptide subunit release factor 1 (eRF1)
MFHLFQAIELSAESLSNVKFIQEKKLIGRYFDQISQVSIFTNLRTKFFPSTNKITL